MRAPFNSVSIMVVTFVFIQKTNQSVKGYQYQIKKFEHVHNDKDHYWNSFEHRFALKEQTSYPNIHNRTWRVKYEAKRTKSLDIYKHKVFQKNVEKIVPSPIRVRKKDYRNSYLKDLINDTRINVMVKSKSCSSTKLKTINEPSGAVNSPRSHVVIFVSLHASFVSTINHHASSQQATLIGEFSYVSYDTARFKTNQTMCLFNQHIHLCFLCISFQTYLPIYVTYHSVSFKLHQHTHRRKRQVTKRTLSPMCSFMVCNLFSWNTRRPSAEHSPATPVFHPTHQTYGNFWRYFMPYMRWPLQPYWSTGQDHSPMWTTGQGHSPMWTTGNSPLWIMFMPAFSTGYVSSHGGMVQTSQGLEYNEISQGGEGETDSETSHNQGEGTNHQSRPSASEASRPGANSKDKPAQNSNEQIQMPQQTTTVMPPEETTHLTTMLPSTTVPYSTTNINTMKPPLSKSKASENINSKPMMTARPMSMANNLTTIRPQGTTMRTLETTTKKKCNKTKQDKSKTQSGSKQNVAENAQSNAEKLGNNLNGLRQNMTQFVQISAEKAGQSLEAIKNNVTTAIISNREKAHNGFNELGRNISQRISEEKNLSNMRLDGEVNKIKGKWNKTFSGVGSKDNESVGLTAVGDKIQQDWLEGQTKIPGNRQELSVNQSSHANAEKQSGATDNFHGNEDKQRGPNNSFHADTDKQPGANKSQTYNDEFAQLFILPNQFNFTKDGVNYNVPLWWNMSQYERDFGVGLFVTILRQHLPQGQNITKRKE